MSGGGLAVGGGGIGLIIAIVIVAVNAFGGDASVLEDLSGVTVGGGQTSRTPRLPHRRGCAGPRGLPDRGVREQHPGLLGRPDPQLPRGADGVLHGADLERVRTGDHRRRPVLLSRRRQGLHRPRVLPGAHGSVRGAGGSARGGVRAGARVRPPRPGPPRTVRPGGQRRAGTAERLGPHRAAGRLLRGRVGGERRRHRVHHADHGSGRRRRARCGRGGRRRPDPARDPGTGEPRDVDARIVGGTPAVVPDRLSRRATRTPATRSAARSEPFS